jgi:transposase-like protein
MGRPVSGVKAFLEWRERLKRFESSGLSIDAFCQQEDVGRSQFGQWLRALRGKHLNGPATDGETRLAEGPAFVPVMVKPQFIEILLPGGGLVRLSASIDRAVLLDVIRVVSTVLQESPS